MSLDPPPATRRLFAHYEPSEIAAPAARDFVVARLAEEGDRRDLRWLLASLGEEELARRLAPRAGRALSRRSRAFWALVLDLEEPAAVEGAEELWPG